MPTIVKVGFCNYLVPKAADAAKLVTLLAGAVPLKSDYIERKWVYWPEDETDRSEISLVTVPMERILKRDPRNRNVVDVVASKQVSSSKPLLLLGQ